MKSVAVGIAVAAIAVVIVVRDPRAQAQVFELQHLSPGKMAPEITGTDVSGKQMKLSDYRGKIVMLDFFGNW
jgi:cytochrome oxidase Cu insertion factor (SCO1/SenC/PrrC family)